MRASPVQWKSFPFEIVEFIEIGLLVHSSEAAVRPGPSGSLLKVRLGGVGFWESISTPAAKKKGYPDRTGLVPHALNFF